MLIQAYITNIHTMSWAFLHPLGLLPERGSSDKTWYKHYKQDIFIIPCVPFNIFNPICAGRSIMSPKNKEMRNSYRNQKDPII